MKKTLITIIAFCFILASSAFGQDLTGEMLVGGYLGYSIGMGDVFKDYGTGGFKYESSAGICFGGTFYYGMNEKMMIGGELGFQSYKFEAETPAIGLIPATSTSASETELNILANGLYALSYDDENAFFLIGGAGLYDYGGMKFGINAGIVYRKMVSDKIGIYGSPRFHIVFADKTFELLQITAGVQMMLGGDM